MDEHDWLAERFEGHRNHLRAVAYRMLGSFSDADDAVQEAWLRLSRSDTSDVENLGGWLTTIVARVSLNMLQSRKARREEPVGAYPPDGIRASADGASPEYEAVLADSVGLALLVVLDTLTPAERLAFVLHDMFAMPFGDGHPDLGEHPPQQRQGKPDDRARVAVDALDERRAESLDAERARHGHRLTAGNVGGHLGLAGRAEADRRARHLAYAAAVTGDQTVPGEQRGLPPGQPPPHVSGLPGRRRLAEPHPVKLEQRVAARVSAHPGTCAATAIALRSARIATTVAVSRPSSGVSSTPLATTRGSMPASRSTRSRPADPEASTRAGAADSITGSG